MRLAYNAHYASPFSSLCCVLIVHRIEIFQISLFWDSNAMKKKLKMHSSAPYACLTAERRQQHGRAQQLMKIATRCSMLDACTLNFILTERIFISRIKFCYFCWAAIRYCHSFFAMQLTFMWTERLSAFFNFIFICDSFFFFFTHFIYLFILFMCKHAHRNCNFTQLNYKWIVNRVI